MPNETTERGDCELSGNGYSSLRVGLFGIGLAAYWPQFPGLRERLTGYVDEIAARFRRPGVEVCEAGMIDSARGALAAGRMFRRADVDIVFLYVTTYAVSATVLPLIRRLRVPVVILNLQPTSQIDYVRFNNLADRQKMTGEWLAYCSSCSVAELVNVFHRCGQPVHMVTGTLRDPEVARRFLGEWFAAAPAHHCAIGVGHLASTVERVAALLDMPVVHIC